MRYTSLTVFSYSTDVVALITIKISSIDFTLRGIKLIILKLNNLNGVSLDFVLKLIKFMYLFSGEKPKWM